MEKNLVTNGGQLTYSVYGNGEALVFIHGFGEDRRIWDHQVEFLEQNYQLIVPDLRGTGSSTFGNRPTAIEDFADDLKLILDAEHISECVLLGHSMGGYITLAFAEKYPAYIKAFGLIHSTAYADSEEKKEARRKSIAFIKEHGAFPFMQTTIPGLFANSFNQQHKSIVDELVEQSRQFSEEALIRYYEAMIARPDRTEVLKTSTVPVLFFIGTEDKAVNPQDAIKQTSLPSICKVNLTEDIAHMGMLEATNKLNECIVEFINTIQILNS